MALAIAAQAVRIWAHAQIARRPSLILNSDSRHRRLNLCCELIIDGARPGSELFGGDDFVALAAEKDDFIAHFDIRDVGDVGHAHVHADAAADWRAFAVDEDIGEVGECAVVAVVIADGEDDDARGVCRLIGAAVANDGADVDEFFLCDDGFPGQSGAQIDVFAEEFGTDVAFGRGPHAVAGDAGADEFAMGVGPQDSGGRVGDGAHGRLEAVCRQDIIIFIEDSELFVGEAVIRRVFDVGKMRAGAFENEIGIFLNIFDEFEGFGNFEALSLRAGFEFDDQSNRLGGFGTGCAEGIDLCLVVSHDAEIELYCGCGVRRGDVSHDEKLAVIAIVAQILGFVE